MAEEYLTTQNEAERIVDSLKEKLTGGLLKDMFASSNRRVYARELMEEYFKDALYNRPHVNLPTAEQMQCGLRAVLEDIADKQAVQAY